ncbi:MAG: nicotinate-nucleotide adenylyltransferase [Candidatus Limnocylindrales bacterium]
MTLGEPAGRDDDRGPLPVAPGRVGILGGTFDPIHIGHLALAEAAREALGLERVLFVPASLPPHRSVAPAASATDRAAMVERAIAGNPAFELSLVELERGGSSYTAETVEQLAADVRRDGHEPDLHFILSAEAFAGFSTWNEPARVLAACRLVVLPREGHPPPDLAAFEAALPGRLSRVTVLDGPGIRLSASEIRARAGRGLSVRYLVPEAVRAYIAERRLYRSARPASVDADTPDPPTRPTP